MPVVHKAAIKSKGEVQKARTQPVENWTTRNPGLPANFSDVFFRISNADCLCALSTRRYQLVAVVCVVRVFFDMFRRFGVLAISRNFAKSVRDEIRSQTDFGTDLRHFLARISNGSRTDFLNRILYGLWRLFSDFEKIRARSVRDPCEKILRSV